MEQPKDEDSYPTMSPIHFGAIKVYNSPSALQAAHGSKPKSMQGQDVYCRGIQPNQEILIDGREAQLLTVVDKMLPGEWIPKRPGTVIYGVLNYLQSNSETFPNLRGLLKQDIMDIVKGASDPLLGIRIQGASRDFTFKEDEETEGNRKETVFFPGHSLLVEDVLGAFQIKRLTSPELKVILKGALIKALSGVTVDIKTFGAPSDLKERPEPVKPSGEKLKELFDPWFNRVQEIPMAMDLPELPDPLHSCEPVDEKPFSGPADSESELIH